MRISREIPAGCLGSERGRLTCGTASRFQSAHRRFRSSVDTRQPLAGILLGRAGLWVPGPAVPGAYHLATFDHSLPQRAAAMQANVVHGAVGAVYVGYADGFRAAGKFFGFVGGREFGLAGELRECRHSESDLPRCAWLDSRGGCPTWLLLPLATSVAAFARSLPGA